MNTNVAVRRFTVKLAADLVTSHKEHGGVTVGSLMRYGESCARNGQKKLAARSHHIQGLAVCVYRDREVENRKRRPMHAYQKQKNTVDNKVHTTNVSSAYPRQSDQTSLS
jgi:pyrimidine operon attenuation protein/uracil phosphoribosyltransferase